MFHKDQKSRKKSPASSSKIKTFRRDRSVATSTPPGDGCAGPVPEQASSPQIFVSDVGQQVSRVCETSICERVVKELKVASLRKHIANDQIAPPMKSKKDTFHN